MFLGISPKKGRPKAATTQETVYPYHAVGHPKTAMSISLSVINGRAVLFRPLRQLRFKKKYSPAVMVRQKKKPIHYCIGLNQSAASYQRCISDSVHFARPSAPSKWLPCLSRNRKDRKQHIQKTTYVFTYVVKLISGFLSSREASLQVLSAFAGLTAVFGMGTGGSPQLSPLNFISQGSHPDNCIVSCMSLTTT